MRPMLAPIACLALAACSAPPSAPVPPQTTPFDASVRIPSGGEALAGTLHVAAGPGPHPTIIWFHGFPGLDQPAPEAIDALRDASLNVLYFHYRGSWAQGGEFSPESALEDAAAALDFVLASDNAARYRVDTDAVVAIGDSFGSWVALKAAAADARFRCAGGALVLNLGMLGEVLAVDPAARESFAGMFGAVDADPAIGFTLHGGADGMANELVGRRAEYDLNRLAGALAARPVMLLGAEADELAPPDANLVPLVAALEAAGARSVRSEVIPGGHDLPDAVFAPRIADWIRDDCTL